MRKRFTGDKSKSTITNRASKFMSNKILTKIVYSGDKMPINAQH